MIGLRRSAFRSALVASAAIALVGVVAGAVRLLPWLLDPAVPWRVAAPFARGLAAVALEAAFLVGWPVGWALACFRFVESGEARVLLTLGERPAFTVHRLSPEGALLALALSAIALLYANDASAPGRVATELVSQARASCTRVKAPTTYAIPFTAMTWLCAPGREPRLVGSPPGAMASIVVTARDARIAGDFRAVELDDAHVALPGAPGGDVHVSSLSIHGMAPWARASTLPPILRALLLALSGWVSAALSAFAVLRHAARTRVGAIVIGASGPLATLGLLRLLERVGGAYELRGPRLLAFAALPFAAAGASLVGALAIARLRRTGRAASSMGK